MAKYLEGPSSADFVPDPNNMSYTALDIGCEN